jgi:UPF0755 protein
LSDDVRPHGRHASAEGTEGAEGGVVALFGTVETYGPSRSERRRNRRRRRRGGIIAVLAGLVILAVVLAGVAAIPSFIKRFQAKDFTGPGTGSTLVQVKEGQTADEIGQTLVKHDVVASTRAFINAAKSSGRSAQFQPGFFRMRQRMSAKTAVSWLLDSRNRVFSKLTLPEGLISLEMLPMLAKATGVPLADLQAAAKQLDQLGIPDGYGAKSVEGFLFPQTYEFDPEVTATDVLQQLVAQYVAVDKELDFDSAATAIGMKPYQALIVASMIEEEAKFPADMARVARVIYNRYHNGDPLGIDATSVYGARIAGKDPRDLTYNEKTPYNTRHDPGLPPTAISNPGQPAMKAAVHPAAGAWKWYVSKDAAGHLAFFDNYDDFLAAKAVCKAKGWGCG